MIDPVADARLAAILFRARVIACVGLSDDPSRPSHDVAAYLVWHGYRVIPVNPALVGRALWGEPARASLAEIAERVDMLDVFRRPDAVPALVSEALRVLPGLGCVWLQIGVRSAAAQAMCAAAGVAFVEERCTKIEHRRLLR